MRCRGGKSKLCERTGSVLQVHGRIMFGSWLDHGRIGRALEMTLQLFSDVFGEFFLDFGVQFCVAGAVFGEVGG